MLKKWAEQEVKEKASQPATITNKKRKLLTQSAAVVEEVFDMTSDDHEIDPPVFAAAPSTRGRKKK